MKVYARQIPPDKQESDLQRARVCNKAMALYGNPKLKKCTNNIFDEVLDATKYNDLNSWVFSNIDKQKMKNVIKLMYNYNTFPNNNTLCKLLSIVTNAKWTYTVIQDVNLSNWQYLYYKVGHVTGEDVYNVSIDYFNRGSEWIIHESDTIFTNPDEIAGLNYYFLTNDCTKIKEKIASFKNCSVADIVLYKFKGYKKIREYEIE